MKNNLKMSCVNNLFVVYLNIIKINIMKIKPAKKKFQPVKLKVVVESQEELDALNDMCKMNITLPQAVQNEFGKYKLQIRNFLDALGDACDGSK